MQESGTLAVLGFLGKGPSVDRVPCHRVDHWVFSRPELCIHFLSWQTPQTFPRGSIHDFPGASSPQ